MPPTISCPRCGHSYSNPQAVEKPGGHIMDTPTLWVQQEGEVAVMLEEVRRLAGLIHQINEERARLLRKVNSMQAATRRLPPEVLSTIFQITILWQDIYEEEDDFQIVLGAVSSHWREIARATPQLWTTISVKFCETVGESNVSLLNLYFENSRGLPMTVELDFRAQLALMIEQVDSDWQEREELTSLIEPLEDSFLNNGTKIRNLIVIGLPMEWISLINKCFRCEAMALYWPLSFTREWQSDAQPLNLSELPSLHHLRLKDLIIPFILPWSMITTLQFHGVPIKYCVESLIKCPNLVKFETLGFGRDTSRDSLPSLNRLVVLENLESLTWYTHEDPWNSAFLCHIRFIKLQVLKLSAISHDDSLSEIFYNDLATFFSGLPETLRVFELANIWYGYRFMKTVLTGTPHLAELILDSCGPLARSMAIRIIGRPVGGLVEDIAEWWAVAHSNQLDGAKVLPRLRELVIITTYGILKAEMIMIVGMLEALHGARVMRECFYLDLPSLQSTWGLELLERLKQLAESGFEFEITIDSRPLNYMSPSVDG